MQVSHVDKNMLEQSSTLPQSIFKEDLNHTLGLTLSTPGLVLIIFSLNLYLSLSCDDGQEDEEVGDKCPDADACQDADLLDLDHVLDVGGEGGPHRLPRLLVHLL